MSTRTFCFTPGCTRLAGPDNDAPHSIMMELSLSFRDWHDEIALAIVSLYFCSPECSLKFLNVTDGSTKRPKTEREIITEIIKLHRQWLSRHPSAPNNYQPKKLSGEGTIIKRITQVAPQKKHRVWFYIPTHGNMGESQLALQLSLESTQVWLEVCKNIKTSLELLEYLAERLSK